MWVRKHNQSLTSAPTSLISNPKTTMTASQSLFRLNPSMQVCCQGTLQQSIWYNAGGIGQSTANLQSDRNTDCFQESIEVLAAGTTWQLPQHGGFPADFGHCTAQQFVYIIRPPLSISSLHATGLMQELMSSASYIKLKRIARPLSLNQRHQSWPDQIHCRGHATASIASTTRRHQWDDHHNSMQVT